MSACGVFSYSLTALAGLTLRSRIIFSALIYIGVLVPLWWWEFPPRVIRLTAEAKPGVRAHLLGGVTRNTGTNGQPELRIAAFGDWGSGTDAQTRVATMLESRCATHGLDAVLVLGDNFYMSGVVSADDEQWRTKFQQIYNRDCLKKLPFYVVLGNHDYRLDAGAQIEYTAREQLPRWLMPSRLYSVRWQRIATFIGIDTTFFDWCGVAAWCARDFVRQELHEAPSDEWRLVFAHHPVSSGSTAGSSHRGGRLQHFLLPDLCRGADIFLAGHSHHMEHRRVGDCPTDLFIAGSGGADLYPVDKNADGTRFAASAHGFLELDLTRDSLTARFIDVSGTELYQYQRQRVEAAKPSAQP